MIVQGGQIKLLEQELSYLATLDWGLFTSNLTISATTTASTVTAAEASWTGYSRSSISGWATPTTVSGSAQSAASGLLTFSNGSGSTQTFYGWFGLDPGDGTLVAAINTGAQTIPASGSYSFSAAITNTNTGP